MKRLSIWPIVAFLIVALPLLVLAFPQPPAGNTGAPGDSTCASCHSGISTTGTTSVTFPSGTTYTPGVKQHLSVTVNDISHNAWSFQLTARLASNLSGGQAGSFTATDAANTIVVTNGAIQDIETTSSGISLSTWSFDWTPPATNVGNVNFYLIGLAAGGSGGSTNGNGIYSASYVLTPAVTAVPDFSLTASPTSLALTQGTSGTSTITVTPKNGFNGTVAYTASGLPTGVTASFNSGGVMTLSASSTAATGTSTVTITGTSGNLSHTTTVALTVNAAVLADFSISASPSTLALSQGSSGTSSITVTPKNGFAGSVALAASGLPSGVTASFSSSGVMTLSASSTAAAGSSTVTITGTSGTLNHTTTVALTVSSVVVPDFSISASPSSVTLTQGSSGSSTISVTPQNGFSGTVAFKASGLPSGVSAAFSAAGTMALSASGTATTGTSTVTVTGTSGSLSHTTTVLLTVNSAASPTLTLTPSTLSFAYQIGGAAPATQNISVTTGGTLAYTVSATGGTWLTASPASGSGSGNVTVSANPAGLAAGTYSGTITITAPGAAGSPQSVKVTLVVTQQSQSTLSVSPVELNFVSQNQTTTAAIAPQKLTITSSGASVSYLATETTQSGGNWLMLGSSGGTTPGTLAVSVNPAGLASGTYHGTITITPSGSSAGTPTGRQTVPVTFVVGSGPTSSSLYARPRVLTFSFSGGNDTSSKMVRVFSQAPREFTAAASGGSWLSVSPTSATTPTTLTVTVDAHGLATGTYSGMVTLAAGTKKTSLNVTVNIATGSGGGEDDGSESESEMTVQPVVNDPSNSDAVGAQWLDAAGVPAASQTTGNSGTRAIALSKSANAPATATAGVQVVSMESLTKLTELGFDVRQGGHCTASSPHFVVVTSDDVTHFFTGCATGTIQTAPAAGWIRVRFDPANPAQASPPIAPGQQIKSIAVVLDEGPEASPNPGGGLVVLDNIDVNGVIIGKD